MSFNPLPESLQNTGLESSQQYLDAKANVVLAESGQEGLSGFLFDIPSSESVNLRADMTDHYTEDNSYLHDHRVIKPAQITLSGFIGELVQSGGGDAVKFLSTISNRLGSVGAYLGDLTPQAVQVASQVAAQAAAAAKVAENALLKAKGLVDAFSGDEPLPTKQQIAYNQLKALFTTHALLTLQTPWNYFENLMITSLGFTRNEESTGISDITISLKEIRISKTKTASYDVAQAVNRAAIQAGAESNTGVNAGSEGGLKSILSKSPEVIKGVFGQ